MPLPGETAVTSLMLVITGHSLGVPQCVIQSTSSTPFRRLVSLLVLVIVLVVAVRAPMPALPELPPLHPLPLAM